jgi:hypothetical protein
MTRSLPARAFQVAFRLLLYVAVSAIVLNLFMLEWGFRSDNARFSFDRIVTQTAHRPFAYRVLMPLTIRGVAAVLDAPTQPVRRALAPKIAHMRARYQLIDAYEFEQLVAYFLLLAILVGVLFVWRSIGATALPGPPLLHDIAPLIGLLLLPLTFIQGGYLYDFPELLLSSAAILCLLRRWWLLYYVAFVLAALNKESNVLLIGAFAAAAWPLLSRTRLAVHLAIQAAIAVAIVMGGRIIFAGNPGLEGELHLFDNLRFFLSPIAYANLFDIYAPLVLTPRGFNLVSLFVFGMLFAYRWRSKPPETRRILLALVALIAPLYLALGYRDEIRVFYMAAGPLYVAGLHTVLTVYGVEPTPAGTPPAVTA